jgi:ABC-2 type transport system permease protein
VRKYLSLYSAFFRASLTADLEFRVNFATRILTDIFWYLAQVVSFEVLFNFTDNIGGWNRDEMRVFLGILFVIDAVFMVIFSSNLDNLSDSVRKGNLDLLLTKPVNSQFIISCQRASTAHLGNLLLAFVWLGWALSRLEGFAWWRLGWLALAIPSGVLIFYGCRFFFSACAVIFTRAENLQYLWYHLYKLGMRPDTIYFPWLRFVVLTAIPVGLIASVPAQAVLGTADPWLVLWGVAAAGLIVLLSGKFWRYALRHYTSASS